MKRLPFILLLFPLLLATVSLPGAFTAPRVDLMKVTPSATAGMAIWSSSSVVEALGSTIAVSFPPGTVVPATSISGCECVFMKYSVSWTGTAENFTASEVTITSGSISGDTVTLALPVSIGVGAFYIRFDETFNMQNPPMAGPTMLILGDTKGVPTASQPYFLGWAENEASIALVRGFVTSSGTPSVPVPGALVMLDTANPAGYHPAPWGPRATGVAAMDTTITAYTAVSGYDGGYILSVPALSTGTAYSIKAFVTYMQGGAPVTQYGQPSPATVTLIAGQTAISNISLTYR
jgi:hypothetical protein